MFCKTCGKTIEEDSRFCAYCGTHLEDGAPEDLDWEEADRRREAIESMAGALANAAVKKAKSGQWSQADHCVRPGAPRKICKDCGKELPSSAIDNICAMCTIRQRNRALEQERDRGDKAAQNRDRYDISDEFDQSVFQGTVYFSGEEPAEEPEYRRTKRLEKQAKTLSDTTGWQEKGKAKSKGTKIIVWAIVLFIAFRIFPAFFSFGQVMIEQVEELFGTSMTISTSSQEDAPKPDVKSEEETKVEDQKKAVYEQFIEPYIPAYLDVGWTDQYPEGSLDDFTSGVQFYEIDGIYHHVGGTGIFLKDSTKEVEIDPIGFSITFIILDVDGSIDVNVAKVEIGDVFSFDVTPYLDENGLINEYGAEESEGQFQVGDAYYAGTPIEADQWEELLSAPIEE